MKRTLSPETLLMVLIALVVVLPLALGGWYVFQKHQWAQSRLAELEPRYARLQGLQESAQDLAKANAQARALLSQYVYAADQDASQVGNSAQQRIRDIFTAAGLQIVSSQVLASKAEKGVDKIPLSVRTEGELLALQSALAVLSSQTPAIIVNGLNVQTQGSVKADTPQRLASQFDLFVLRARP